MAKLDKSELDSVLESIRIEREKRQQADKMAIWENSRICIGTESRTHMRSVAVPFLVLYHSVTYSPIPQGWLFIAICENVTESSTEP